jgi:hypothetical protein
MPGGEKGVVQIINLRNLTCDANREIFRQGKTSE